MFRGPRALPSFLESLGCFCPSPPLLDRLHQDHKYGNRLYLLVMVRALAPAAAAAAAVVVDGIWVDGKLVPHHQVELDHPHRFANPSPC